jgi:hypothetical protein
VQLRTVPTPTSILAYPFFACALTFAHRFFAAPAIAALPAADRTRFLTPLKRGCRKAFLALRQKQKKI